MKYFVAIVESLDDKNYLNFISPDGKKSYQSYCYDDYGLLNRAGEFLLFSALAMRKKLMEKHSDMLRINNQTIVVTPTFSDCTHRAIKPTIKRGK